VSDVALHKKYGLKIKDMAKSKWVYRRLRNFRVGISCLKRAYGLTRYTWRDLDHLNPSSGRRSSQAISRSSRAANHQPRRSIIGICRTTPIVCNPGSKAILHTILIAAPKYRSVELKIDNRRRAKLRAKSDPKLKNPVYGRTLT
jgi:hypothetical protein